MDDMPDRSGHLTPQEVTAYLQRALTLEERWKIDAHLSSCPECRRRVRLDHVEETMVTALQSDLQSALQEEETHLAYEEMEDYLEDRADACVREIVEAHVAQCSLCATELQELRAFRLLIRAETTPIQETSITVADTTGLVKVRSGRAFLAHLDSISRALLHRIGEFLETGFVEPIPALQNRIALLQRATTPTMARSRGQENPIPLAPAFTAIRSASPVFHWTPLPDADVYHLVLAALNKQGERVLLWQGEAESGTGIPLPANVSLEPGKAYLWYVKAQVGREERPSPFAWFTLLTPAALRQVEQAEQRIASSALALACLYERYGLYQEALFQVERLLALNPGHPSVLTMHQRLRALSQPMHSSH